MAVLYPPVDEQGRWLYMNGAGDAELDTPEPAARITHYNPIDESGDWELPCAWHEIPNCPSCVHDEDLF